MSAFTNDRPKSYDLIDQPFSRMKGQFHNVPEHITSELDSWSMADFISVRNGSFQKEKTDLIRRCEKHIFECEVSTSLPHLADFFF